MAAVASIQAERAARRQPTLADAIAFFTGQGLSYDLAVALLTPPPAAATRPGTPG